MNFFDEAKAWFVDTAWPTIASFFGGVVHSEVNALTPIAQQAVASLAVEEAQALASGNTKDTGHILAKVVQNTAAAAENASMQSVLVAVGAALPVKAAAAATPPASGS